MKNSDIQYELVKAVYCSTNEASLPSTNEDLMKIIKSMGNAYEFIEI